MIAKPDIKTKEDIELVVNKHYQLLTQSEQTKAVFNHINIESHLPRIYNFWCFVLQINPEENSYIGNVFEPHVKLHLTKEHFNYWLLFLNQAIFSQFEGEKANEWYQKAETQAALFRYKLGIGDDIYFKNNK